MRSSARVGVGEGAVARRSTTRRRGDVLLGARRRGRRRGGLQLYLMPPFSATPSTPRLSELNYTYSTTKASEAQRQH